MKKFIALLLCLMMVLAMVACGEAAPQTPKQPTGTEDPGQTEDPGTAAGQSLLDVMETYALPETLANTGWTFKGGYVDGEEMSEELYNAALEQYGGVLQIIFADETTVYMVQGGGTLEGTYSQADEKTITVEFPDAGLTYAGMFTANGDAPVLVMFSDATGNNAMYYSQISEG